MVRSPAARARTIRARCTWNHGEALASGDFQEVRFVNRMNAKSIGFSAAHGMMTPGNLAYHCQLSKVCEFRAVFLSGDTSLDSQGSETD